MKRLNLLSILVAASVVTPAFSSSLQGEMDDGYAVPYLWDSYPGYFNSDWMADIDDSTKLSELSIPGTDNSISVSGQLSTVTQTLDIFDQLRMGIRYFDMSFSYRDSQLQASTLNSPQPTTFEGFMAHVSEFLQNNPSETVIIRVKNTSGSHIVNSAFNERFKAITDRFSEQYFIPNSNNPTIAEARGKFIFIQDFSMPGETFGIDVNDLFIQERVSVIDSSDLYAMWEEVKAHFNNIESFDQNSISVNYLAALETSFPYFVASGKVSQGTFAPQLLTEFAASDLNQYPDFLHADCADGFCNIFSLGTNQLTDRWIEDGELTGNLGIVAMNFPGGSLVDHIIQQNAPLITLDNGNNGDNGDNGDTGSSGDSGNNGDNDSSSENDTNNVAVSSFTIYDGVDYHGNSLAITGDVASLGSWEDRMSSWAFPEGYQVRFYEHENFTGRYFTRSQSGNATGFNNIVSSVKVLQRPEVFRIYDESNYNGSSLVIHSDMASLGEWSDKMSSWVIPEGWQVRFYRDENFKGGYYTREHSGNAAGFNDDIGSIKILKRPEKMVIFDTSHQQGSTRSIVADIADLEEWDLRMSSWSIPEGWTVRFYREKDFKGGYYSRKASGNAVGFNNKTRSIKILRRPDVLTIFEQKDFEGDGLNITEDMPSLGRWDNRISSWGMPEGWEVRFYEDENYQGNSWVVKHGDNTTALTDKIISSIKFIKHTPAAVTLYSDNNHQGEKFEVTGDISSLGDFNNKMSSWVMPVGWQVRFYEHENFTGRSWVSRTSATMERLYNNKISSVKIIQKLDSLVIHDEAGSSRAITNLEPTLGDWDDRMTSFYLPPGWKVRFYEDENYQGRSWTYTSSGEAIGFEKKVSSIKLLNIPVVPIKQ